MIVKVIFTNDIFGCDLRRITSLTDLSALDAVFFLEVKVPNVDDFEEMANIIENIFSDTYPDKRFTSYSIKMPRMAC